MWTCVEKDAAFSVYHCVHINAHFTILKFVLQTGIWTSVSTLGNRPSVRREAQIPDGLNPVLPVKTTDT